jgi:hypothetical protein
MITAKNCQSIPDSFPGLSKAQGLFSFYSFCLLISSGFGQDLPSRGNIGMDLRRQGLDGGEAPLFPEAGEKFHLQVFAIQIGSEIKQVHFQG